MSKITYTNTFTYTSTINGGCVSVSESVKDFIYKFFTFLISKDLITTTNTVTYTKKPEVFT